MSIHEIEIEGLPEGYEPVKATYIGAALGKTETHTLALEIRRKVRKYDWSKTLDDVLIGFTEGAQIYQFIQIDAPYPLHMRIATIWQPNIHGKCPVDGEACHVKLKFSDGHEWHGKASEYEWSHPKDGTFPALIAWQFIRLADGYEW